MEFYNCWMTRFIGFITVYVLTRRNIWDADVSSTQWPGKKLSRNLSRRARKSKKTYSFQWFDRYLDLTIVGDATQKHTETEEMIKWLQLDLLGGRAWTTSLGCQDRFRLVYQADDVDARYDIVVSCYITSRDTIRMIQKVAIKTTNIARKPHK